MFIFPFLKILICLSFWEDWGWATPKITQMLFIPSSVLKSESIGTQDPCMVLEILNRVVHMMQTL